MSQLGLFKRRYPELQRSCVTLEIGPGAPPADIAAEWYRKVRVTCALQASESRWGRHQNNNAVLLRIRIQFQDLQYRLDHFVLEIKLSQTGPQPDSRAATTLPSEVYALMDPWPTQAVIGPPIVPNCGSENEVAPEVSVAGISVKLLRFLRRKDISEPTSWSFSSNAWSSRTGLHDTLSWTWKANPQAQFAETVGSLYGAFVCRAADPFFLLCRFAEGQVHDKDLRIFRTKVSCPQEEPFVRQLTPVTSAEELAPFIAKLEAELSDINRLGAVVRKAQE